MEEWYEQFYPQGGRRAGRWGSELQRSTLHIHLTWLLPPPPPLTYVRGFLKKQNKTMFILHGPQDGLRSNMSVQVRIHLIPQEDLPLMSCGSLPVFSASPSSSINQGQHQRTPSPLQLSHTMYTPLQLLSLQPEMVYMF